MLWWKEMRFVNVPGEQQAGQERGQRYACGRRFSAWTALLVSTAATIALTAICLCVDAQRRVTLLVLTLGPSGGGFPASAAPDCRLSLLASSQRTVSYHWELSQIDTTRLTRLEHVFYT